jgi:hypothetical protein
MGHQGQQAEQHTGCRQQDGQDLRELDSEENHGRFPAPRERDDDVVSIGRDRESCVYRPVRRGHPL